MRTRFHDEVAQCMLIRSTQGGIKREVAAALPQFRTPLSLGIQPATIVHDEKSPISPLWRSRNVSRRAAVAGPAGILPRTTTRL